MHEGISAEHLDGEGHLAMALCRPGRPEITEDDDGWAEALREVLDDGQIDGTWSLHLAAAGRVVPWWTCRRDPRLPRSSTGTAGRTCSDALIAAAAWRRRDRSCDGLLRS